MATFNKFEDIEAWHKARALAKVVYELTTSGTFARDFGLRDQINRATGSTMDNIAEGFERGGNLEFIQFLSYSKGSTGETRSQLYRALDRKHISESVFNDLSKETFDISKMINGLIAYLNKGDFKGAKFKDRN